MSRKVADCVIEALAQASLTLIDGVMVCRLFKGQVGRVEGDD